MIERGREFRLVEQLFDLDGNSSGLLEAIEDLGRERLKHGREAADCQPFKMSMCSAELVRQPFPLVAVGGLADPDQQPRRLIVHRRIFAADSPETGRPARDG